MKEKTSWSLPWAVQEENTVQLLLQGHFMNIWRQWESTVSASVSYTHLAQTVKALAEAEAYPGPSLIIAYAPCINHGIKKGMDKAMTEEKLALECGYWNNFRYNPAAEKKFTLDSKAPKMEGYQDFLKGEVRYLSLTMKNPDRAARCV